MLCVGVKPKTILLIIIVKLHELARRNISLEKDEKIMLAATITTTNQMLEDASERSKQLEISIVQLNERYRSEMEEKNVMIEKLKSDIIKSVDLNTSLNRLLQKKDEELKFVQDNHSDYRLQAKMNFDLLMKDVETVEQLVEELTSHNFQLRSQVKLNRQRLESFELATAVCKAEVEALEARNALFSETMCKHEITHKKLLDDYLTIYKQKASVENQIAFLEHECQRLRQARHSVEIENEILRRDQKFHILVQAEMIKHSSEQSHIENQLGGGPAPRKRKLSSEDELHSKKKRFYCNLM